MFTLSGLILGTRQNLFRDFWSPFSISFYFSSERIYKKKTGTDSGPYPARKPPARPLYSARPGKRESQPSPCETLAAAAFSRRRRSRAPFEVCRRLVFHAVLKKIVRRFSFSSDFSAVIFWSWFLIQFSFWYNFSLVCRNQAIQAPGVSSRNPLSE